VKADELLELGALLRARGLTERAALACFGGRAVVHAMLRAELVRAPERAVLPWLLVGGRPVARSALEALLGAGGAGLLARAGIVELGGEEVVPRRLVLPVGESLVVADRIGGGTVQPDDSSFHLAGALPARRVDRWLDVGTGPALVPLGRRGLARRVLATDVDPHALSLAELGAGLSGAREIEIGRADLLDGAGGERFELVTFNAPLPRDGGLDLVARFWAGAPAVVAAGGEALVHSAIPEQGAPHLLDLPGEVAVAIYTPPGAEIPFGVTRWRPSRPPGRHAARVELRSDRPHLTRADLPTD
jgi:hypothetical protein